MTKIKAAVEGVLTSLRDERVHKFGLLVLSAAFGAGLLWHFSNADDTPDESFGSILIDTPQVYTRERLVNDRFLEEAWLTQQLAESDKVLLRSLGSTTEELARSIRSAEGNGVGSGELVPPQPAMDTQLGSLAALEDKVDYRDLVRGLLRENQLDDRHDLNGNTLYRLQFDATLIPGEFTRSPAKLQVVLTGPWGSPSTQPLGSCIPPALAHLGSNSEIENWRKRYLNWLANLRSRLNQTHREQKQSFYNNEFTEADYERLRDFIASNVGVTEAASEHCDDANNANACLTDILRISLERDSRAREVNQGQYAGEMDNRKEDYPEPTMQPTPAVPRFRVEDELDRWLNAYFASKTLQLVLGIDVPQSSFVGVEYYGVPALQPLSKLVFFNPDFQADDGNVFSVTPRSFDIPAIELGKSIDDLASMWRDDQQIDRVGNLFKARDQKDFREHEGVDGLLISEPDFNAMGEQSYRLGSCDFNEVQSQPGAYLASAEVGLLNFSKQASTQRRTYAYAVTPKERAVSRLVSTSRASSVEGRALDTFNVDVSRRARQEALVRSGSVVGFARATNDTDRAVFGWIIGPDTLVARRFGHDLVQSTQQHTLSALVSVPSWWDKARLRLSTSWIDSSDGVTELMPTEQEFEIDLPTDFEPLETTLLEVQQYGPEVMESSLDPILLTACSPGAIVIPGRRLWRSTVVTMGYQTADEISVLPNMKGIIAKFRNVENQMNVSEEGDGSRAAVQILRPVRIWTSQGMVALPEPAKIGVPADCDRQTTHSAE